MRVVAPAEAAELLREGSIGLASTETVVGLVAADSGLGRLADIKGRDPGKPIALLCASPEEAFALAAEVPPLAQKLAALFWPGALTLVLDADEGADTIGLRVPDHAEVRALLRTYGGPLYATSANLSGEPAPREVASVDPRVAAAVDFVVAGEPGRGEASAVVDLSRGGIRLLRANERINEETLLDLASGVE